MNLRSKSNSNCQSNDQPSSLSYQKVRDTFRKDCRSINKEKRKQTTLLEARDEAIQELNEATSSTSTIASSTTLTTVETIPISSSNSLLSNETVTYGNNSRWLCSLSSQSESLTNLSVEEKNAALRQLASMVEKSKKNEFPTKIFNKSGKSFGYTSYLHFTNSILHTTEPNQKVEFKCIFCKESINCSLGKTFNVSTHLQKHRELPELIDWFYAYSNENSVKNKSKINAFTIKLVKYFIASNAALDQLDLLYFKDLLPEKVDIPCAKTFCEKTLPEIFSRVNSIIEKKLQSAVSICLISDIWTNKQMLDFLGLAANLVYKNLEREELVVGLSSMIGRHNAENIKAAIELVINRFQFDKSKISGKKIS